MPFFKSPVEIISSSRAPNAPARRCTLRHAADAASRVSCCYLLVCVGICRPAPGVWRGRAETILSPGGCVPQIGQIFPFWALPPRAGAACWRETLASVWPTASCSRRFTGSRSRKQTEETHQRVLDVVPLATQEQRPLPPLWGVTRNPHRGGRGRCSEAAAPRCTAEAAPA